MTAGIALPVVAVALLLTRVSATRSEALQWLPAAAALGIGLSSLPWWVFMIAGTQSVRVMLAVDVALWIGIAALLLLISFGPSSPDWGDRSVNGGGASIASLVLLAAATVAGAAFSAHSIVLPHGEWDAWAMWNLRGRFFFHGFPDRWAAAFYGEILWSAPDYPLLLPLSIARAWTYIGRDIVAVPIAWAALFAGAVVCTAGVSVARIRGAAAGMIAAGAILSSPAFVRYAPWQIADVPMAFFIIATFAFMTRAGIGHAQPSWWVLSGIAAGLAVWTKNEGLLFICALALCAIAFAVCRSPVVSFVAVGWFVLAMAPMLLALAALKFFWSPPNSIVAAQSAHHLIARLSDLERFQIVGRAMAHELWHSGAAIVGPVPITVAYTLVRGRGSVPPPRVASLALAVTAVAMAGYFMIYMVTPHDLQWHLGTSLGRVCVQYLPLSIWAIIMHAR
jgi:hypothetical protein